jgi:hypothetical protein
MGNTSTHEGVSYVVELMFIAVLTAFNRDSLSHFGMRTGDWYFPAIAKGCPTACVGSEAVARDRPLTADCVRAPPTPKAAAQRRIGAIAIARRLDPSRAVPDNGRVTEEEAVMSRSSTATGAQNELRAHLLRMVYGGQVAQTVCVAAKLGLPDLLAAGSRTTSELATRAAIEAPTMRRLLRGRVPWASVARWKPSANEEKTDAIEIQSCDNLCRIDTGSAGVSASHAL